VWVSFDHSVGSGGHRLGRCGPEDRGVVGGPSEGYPADAAYSGTVPHGSQARATQSPLPQSTIHQVVLLGVHLCPRLLQPVRLHESVRPLWARKNRSNLFDCMRACVIAGTTLQDALEQQYDGSYRKSHPGVSGYNEIIISALYWDSALPWAVEAFVFSARPDDERALYARMEATHRDFLVYYGLTAAEVPLLRYRCSQNDIPPAEQGRCFEDVSQR
jgi:hypothetical protein